MPECHGIQRWYDLPSLQNRPEIQLRVVLTCRQCLCADLHRSSRYAIPQRLPFLQRELDMMLLISTALSPYCLVHYLPLKHDRRRSCSENCGPPATLGSLLPFVRTRRGLPIRALGLDQGTLACGIDDLLVVPTSAMVLISRVTIMLANLPLTVETSTEPQPSTVCEIWHGI